MPRLTNALAALWPRALIPVEEKASRTARVVAVEQWGRPVFTPRDYQGFAREGFMQNPIVYRSVRMIAEAAASIPLLLYEGSEELEGHPLAGLVKRPNAEQTSADFLEAFYGYLLVAGNAYVEAVGLAGEVRELHVLRPDRMKVVPGLEGWPEAYEYSADGRTVRFDSEIAPGVRPILHMRLFHPVNDHYGMSPLEAAAGAIDIHNTASRWNKALLDNSARPSGALVLAASDGRLSPEQFDRLKAELETSFQGARQAGRPLLLEGGLDWKPLSLSPKDMDFVEAKNIAAREIALAIGVPPMLLGIPGDNTYSNYQEATRAFWRQTVLPLVNRTAKALSAWLAPSYGGDLALVPDIDQVEALAPEREALWARLNAASFLTLDEKREAAGFAPLGSKVTEGANRQGPFDEARRGGAVAAGLAAKFRPDQPRVPRGNPDGGQWVDEGLGGRDRGRGADEGRLQFVNSRTRAPGPATRLPEMTPGQATRYSIADVNARVALRRVRERDPDWKPTPSLYETAEGAIRAREAEAVEAQARLRELLRGAIPNTNPDWGVNRLRKELTSRGFELVRPTDSPGFLFRNPKTTEEVRIMQRPPGVGYRNESKQKRLNEYYYRYRPGKGRGYQQHTTIPDKSDN